ncbi:MAG: hypothetical protein RL743_1558 [Actinomycetota bacterium]|jgi:molybdopterin converting factor small subunit
MATLRLFASAREAAGRGSDIIDAATVGELLDEACGRYGNAFAAVLATCRVWCNGDETERDAPIGPSDEVAVLPPVSGGF